MMELEAICEKYIERRDAAIGRDPHEIRRSVQLAAGDDPAEIIDRVQRYHAAGFTEIILMLSGGSMSTSADPVHTASMLAEQVLPQLPRG